MNLPPDQQAMREHFDKALPMWRVLGDIEAERGRQDTKFPDQHLPSGTGDRTYAEMAEDCKRITDEKARRGTLTWADVLREEYYEALAEEDPAKLRAELAQVAAVAVRWIEDLDRGTN